MISNFSATISLQQKFIKKNKKKFKETVNVISSDPSFIEWDVRFTTVSFKLLHEQEKMLILLEVSYKSELHIYTPERIKHF